MCLILWFGRCASLNFLVEVNVGNYFYCLGVQTQAAGGTAPVGETAEAAAAGTCLPGVSATAARQEAPALPLQQESGPKQ